MNLQDLLNAGAGLAFASLGWFAREIWAAVKELKSDLAKLREDLPKEYVQKDDFKDGIRELKDMLERLFDKLDKKVDKP